MNDVLLSMGIFSIPPAIALLVFLKLRKTQRIRALANAAWAVLLLALVMSALVWFGNGLSHLDCGDSCSSEVASYGVIDVLSATMVIVWVAVGAACLYVAWRKGREVGPQAAAVGGPRRPDARPLWLRTVIWAAVMIQAVLALMFMTGGLLLLAFGQPSVIIVSLLALIDGFVLLRIRRKLFKYLLWSRALVVIGAGLVMMSSNRDVYLGYFDGAGLWLLVLGLLNVVLMIGAFLGRKPAAAEIASNL